MVPQKILRKSPGIYDYGPDFHHCQTPGTKSNQRVRQHNLHFNSGGSSSNFALRDVLSPIWKDSSRKPLSQEETPWPTKKPTPAHPSQKRSRQSLTERFHPRLGIFLFRYTYKPSKKLQKELFTKYITDRHNTHHHPLTDKELRNYPFPELLQHHHIPCYKWLQELYKLHARQTENYHQ